MQKMSKEELKELIQDVSREVSEYPEMPNTGNKNADAACYLVDIIWQMKENCMNILVETLYRLMEMGKI